MQKKGTFNFGKFMILFVLLLLCIALAMLFYVSISPNVNGINLKKFAENRNEKEKTLYASRGGIYDVSGDPLALSVNSYTLIAYLEESRTTDENDPQHVVDKVMTAQKLSEAIGIDYEEALTYLNKDAYQVEFGKKGRNLTEMEKKKIEELELPGIDFIESTQRYYKMGNFASYIVGYAKTSDNGEIVGELGIESYFDDILAGEDGYLRYQSDAYGYQLPNTPVFEVDAKNGNDIYLTIDSNIQLIAENAIHDLDELRDFDWAIMTVMDANTGAIVASATSPSYNPNDLNTLESYLNPLVSYTYEPGSTMKTFSWAAAIDNDIYDGSETYKSGSIEVADVTISDFNKTGWGNITYDTGYAYSSNVGATNLALKLGRQKLLDYYESLGFGQKTGIELSGELEGKVSFKYKSELATASFGQGGITVTPIQMLQAFTTIANDGQMLKPYIVDRIVDSNGNVTYSAERTVVGTPMSKKAANKMSSLMHNMVYDGLSKIWQPKTVSLIGKTGTAQIADPKGGYLKGEYDNITSFAGIFPEDKPKYIIYVAVKRIVGYQTDISKMTVKAVDEIASYANLNDLDNGVEKTKTIKLENYKSQKTIDVASKLTEEGLTVYTLGTGDYVTSMYPKEGSKVVEGTKVFLTTNKDDFALPDLKGWSLSEVKTFAKLTGITINYNGYGYVDTMSLEVGTPLTKGMLLNVTFKNRKDYPKE